MESLMPYLINTLLGAGGGYLGDMLKKNALGMVGNLIAGAVGGNVLPLLAQTLMGGGDNMIANVITALVGGGLGSVVGGLFKKA